MDKKEVLYRMMLIREMERMIESLFSRGMLRGTTHCCIGQEAVPVALSYLIDIERDYLFGGHRAHGLSMMMTMRPEVLLGEIMGKRFGMAGGVGGSQHVYYKNYFTNGITGGMATIATGAAFALKQEGGDAIAVAVVGDGAMNEGYVMESFNLAAAMRLPVLFVLENNGYAMSTPVGTVNPSTTFEERVRGFSLTYTRVEPEGFDNLFDKLRGAVVAVRQRREPQFVEVMSHRFCGHSKSDKRLYVPKERDEYWLEHDYMVSVAKEMEPEDVEDVRARVMAEVERVYQYCITN